MRNLIGFLALSYCILASHGCSPDTSTTKPQVVSPNPSNSPDGTKAKPNANTNSSAL